MDRVALVGAGEMAESLVRGWLASGQVQAQQIAVTNRSDDARLAEFRREFGVRAHREKAATIRGADVVIMAVKPQDMDEALAQTAPHLARGAVVVTVAAGVSLERCARQLPDHVQLVRAMPNSASRVGHSVTALCRDRGCSPEAFEAARVLFSHVGATVAIEESQFDAVTAVGGSGPAYVYLLVEAMLAAALELGLPERTARDLAVWVVLGAGRMLKDTALPPAALRKQVTSPGGTTNAALAILQEMRVPEAVRRAVVRAASRARELGRVASEPTRPTSGDVSRFRAY